MKIAFVLDHPLMHYRVPFFNLLSRKFDHKVSVFHAGNKLDSNEIFFEQIIVEKKKILKIFDYRKGLDLTSFDIVVCMQNMRLLNLWNITLKQHRSYKLIHWGIGVSSSKGLRSQSNSIRIIRNFLMRFADAVVFYSAYPLQFVKKSLKDKCFIALNTIENSLSVDLSPFPKDALIFIGSLNRRKGLQETIIAFHQYLQRNPKNIRKLFIIGEGEEYANLSEYISSNGLENNILLLGKIENEEEKKKYFKKSIASISLNQAGLSVLESFSFGVPFITKRDAISGGEHLNIIHKENGFLVENMDDFINKLYWLDQNLEDAQILGHNAFKYYNEKANMNLMVSAFEKAIHYAYTRKL